MIHTFDHKIRKVLVTLVIEKTLLNFSQQTYDLVAERLLKDYHCYISDCYDNPEYLQRILKDIYGDVHHKIIKSIEEKLQEFSYEKPIEKFLETIR